MNSNVITIRLSDEGISAYRFLQEKKINPAKYLREGGEIELIKQAQKNRLKIIKIKLPF